MSNSVIIYFYKRSSPETCVNDFNIDYTLLFSKSVNISVGVCSLAETIKNLQPLSTVTHIKINNLLFDVSLCSCSLQEIKNYVMEQWV